MANIGAEDQDKVKIIVGNRELGIILEKEIDAEAHTKLIDDFIKELETRLKAYNGITPEQVAEMKKQIEYADKERAKGIFGIGETASMRTIRESYRKLMKSNHPDRFPAGDKETLEEKVKEINNAYKILMDYCENYEISFRFEDFLRTKIDSKFDDFMKDWF